MSRRFWSVTGSINGAGRCDQGRTCATVIQVSWVVSVLVCTRWRRYNRGVQTRRWVAGLFGIFTVLGANQSRAQNWDYTSPKEPNRALTRLHAKTMTGENLPFRRAIEALDAQSNKRVAGVDMVAAAVSWQTGVSIPRLKAQQVETGLSYGELLVADSLSIGSGNSFAKILRLRSRTQTWAELSLKLRINPGSLVARVQAASVSINNAAGRYNRRHRETVYGLDVVRVPNSQNVPRPFGRGPPHPGG